MPSLRYAQLVLVIMYMASPLMSRTSSGYLLIRCAFVPIAYFVDRRDRTFAYGELDLFECHVGVDVVVGELAHPLLLHGNVRCRTRDARNDHRLGDVAQFIAVGGLDQVARGALNENLHVVVLFEDVVFGRGGLDGDAVFAVVGFEVEVRSDML